MPGVTPQGMDYHHSYGGMNGHGGGYGPGPRNGYGGPDLDQHSMDRFDNTRDMEPTIEMDHLATYSSKSGVMKPEDGLRKLRVMESSTGIWTMRCMMIIERKNLIIVDKGNGDELERFPLDLVHEPTAIFKEDKREVYTNLILFTILENPGKYNSRCDMHIFQSINAPAQEIVDEILAAKEGRPKLSSSSIPPPPMGPAPDPPGGHWLGGIKEPKSHFSYSTDAQDDEEPKVGKREKIINLPGERHFFTDRSIPVGREHNRMPNPLVEEDFDREKYIPLGREETREKVITPTSQKHYVRQMHVPVIEEIRQKNAKSSIPAVGETFVRERYIPLEEMRQKSAPSVKENFVHERYTPHEETQEKTRNPHVKEHFVERRYIPNDRQRRSSLGSHSLTATSEGFPTSSIQEEEFDIPERYLSLTGRRSSSSGGRNRSSSVDRYTLPGSHGNNSLMSDVYAVPYDRRNSERYSVSSRERRASTGGYETPIYTEPRRLSTSSANIYEIPVKMERDSHQYRSEHDLQSALRRDRDSQYRSEHDLQSALRRDRDSQYRSEHDLQSALGRDRDFFPENNTLSSSSRGKWRFGGKRQQYSSSNQGSSSGYSSMEPSVHYTTMPNPKSKSKQSSRFHLKTTTLRDEGIKTNTDGFRSQNEGFRVVQNEGFQPSVEGIRTPIDAFRVQNDGLRSQDVSRDLFSPSIREKDSVNSRGFYGQTQNRALYEASGGQNETLERDVQYLNNCFDDIEKFVARLQQAAEAYKELENRKQYSLKKKNDRGPTPKDGMLNMRAKPPPADDFIDIFQKIKWAFNLLAKLKAHIHDPNAPELVHFIFTPLSLIYEASRDPVHAGIDLASKAVSPLLTREAKELLLNCLTSKELELWQLLGRNWTTSEDETQTNQYKQTIDKDQLEQSLVNHRHQIVENRRAEDARKQESMPQQMPRQLPTPREEPRHEEPPYGRTRKDEEPPYARTRRDEEPTYGRTRRDEEPPYGRTRRDEEPPYGRTRRDEEPPYHTGPQSGYSRNVGSSFAPEMDREPMYERKRPSTPPPGAVANPNVAKYPEYVEKHIDRYQKTRPQENAEFKDDLRRKNAKIYEAVHERNGRNQKEITVEKGDILEVLDDSRNWWRLRNYKGETGYAPYTILRDIGDDRNDVDRNGGHRGSVGGYSGNIGHSQSNHIPAAPPPPRKEEEEFESVIKPIRHMRNDSKRDRTPESSDDDHYSGSLDGSIEDIVDMRSRNYRENDTRQNQNPNYRHSDEIRNQKNARGYNNRSFEEDPPERQKTKPPPLPPTSGPPPPPPQNRPPSGRIYTPPVKAGRRVERDELQNELSKRLSGKPAIKTKPQNHNLYLSTKSSAYDVTEWLRSKSFSERCINQLSGYNGYDLLRMKAKDINSLIGHDEAQRLTGHITLQKNMSGYKTQGSKELQAILQQRKQKADTLEDGDVGRPPGFAPDSPDYSGSDPEDSSEDFGNAGKTLRGLLQHQRKKITTYRYEQ